MSGHNADRSQPPERDLLVDAGGFGDLPPPSGLSAIEAIGNILPGLAIELATVSGTLNEGQEAMGDLNLALAQSNWPAAINAARKLQDAFRRDPKALTHHIAQTIIDAAPKPKRK